MAEPDSGPMERDDRGSRPVPDPTVLTTEALQREIRALERLLTQRIEGLAEVETERFVRVDAQFELVEKQRVEQKTDTKAAVDAALIAQKEAVKEQTTASERAIAKSEAATAKQLEQLGTTFVTALEGLRRDIDGLKERITSVESQRVGEAPNELRQMLAQLSEKVSKIA